MSVCVSVTFCLSPWDIFHTPGGQTLLHIYSLSSQLPVLSGCSTDGKLLLGAMVVKSLKSVGPFYYFYRWGGVEVKAISNSVEVEVKAELVN